jgi:hypothetical protein
MDTRRWFRLAPVAVAFAALVASRPAHAQRRVAVNIDSNPQGATVRVDADNAAPVGTTPMRRTRLPVGAHTLYFSRQGYITEQMQVDVRRRNETYTATLTQAGSIYVSSDVAGAQILLNGNGIGTAPGRIDNLRPGQYVVEVTSTQAGSRPHRETVAVTAGGLATINATLTPAVVAPTTGVVRVILNNPAGAVPGSVQVTFDGAPMTGSGAAYSEDHAAPGQHIVQVNAQGFQSVRREVTVTGGQTVAVAVDLAAIVATSGTVRILVPTPGAQVFLDGELMQGTPPQRNDVPPGTHSLRVTAQGRTTVTRELTVTAGQPVVLEIPDLAVATQTGRISVRSSTPGARVFIDGRDVGPSPFTRDDIPANTYEVTLRAPGFDDRTERCNVTASVACDINLPLTRTVGRATLHIELGRPLRVPAIVVIDGQEAGEIGAGRDIPNIPATTHEIRVRAQGYADFVQSVTFGENEVRPVMVVMRRMRTGPSGAELAMRRTAISTWSASPLAQRDAAIDFLASYGAYPGEIRGTIGILPYGLFGLDGGFSIRSLGWMWEFELRTRIGVRLANGLFALGGELRGFGGVSFFGQSTVGYRAQVMASIHSTAPTSDQDDENIEDPNERSNRPGNIAFTVHFGVEGFADSMNGVRYTRDTPMSTPGMGGQDRVPGIQDLCSAGATSMANGMTRPNMMRMDTAFGQYSCPRQRDFPATGGMASMDPEDYWLEGTNGRARPLIGATFEISVSRHVNLFVQFERVLTGDRRMSRLNYATTWFTYDPLTYVRLGLTYKF